MKKTGSQSRSSAGRRNPGRPKDKTNLRESILDVAEQAFAEAGFAAATTRVIAARADVNQNLIRYYFKTKKALFDEVIRRRGALLAGRRHVLLDRLMADGRDYTLEEVIRAYVQPQWEIKQSGPSGAAFIRLQARLHAEPDEHSLNLRHEVYDAAVQRYIDAVVPLLPDIDRETISVRWAFLVGTYLFMLNDLGRIEDISRGRVTELESEALLANMVAFLAAGFRAPMP